MNLKEINLKMLSNKDEFEKDIYLCGAVHSGNFRATQELLPYAGKYFKEHCEYILSFIISVYLTKELSDTHLDDFLKVIKLLIHNTPIGEFKYYIQYQRLMPGRVENIKNIIDKYKKSV
jgi:hypothetical protein